MTMQFKKAVRTQRKLRMSLEGPSGTGKTFTMLSLLTSLVDEGQRVAVIDTEHESSSIYATQFDFDVLSLTEHHPDTYTAAIEAAVAAGYGALGIDSFSHAWVGEKGMLELVDSLAGGQEGRKFDTGWKKAKPHEQKLWRTVLGAPLHVIVTMRTKTAYEVSRENGKTKIEKLGLAPIQRTETQYEFDIVGEMDQDNTLTIGKTRFSELHNARLPKPGRELAIDLKRWLSMGEAAKPTLTFVVNNRTVTTAGITKDTLLAVWNVSTAYDKATEKGAAKVLLVETTQKDSSVDLTEPEGLAFLDALRLKLAAIEATKGDAA
jgi:hypothetical protein